MLRKKSIGSLIISSIFGALSLFLLISLLSFHANDGFQGEITNLMGVPGYWVANSLFSIFGYASFFCFFWFVFLSALAFLLPMEIFIGYVVSRLPFGTLIILVCLPVLFHIQIPGGWKSLSQGGGILGSLISSVFLDGLHIPPFVVSSVAILGILFSLKLLSPKSFSIIGLLDELGEWVLNPSAKWQSFLKGKTQEPSHDFLKKTNDALKDAINDASGTDFVAAFPPEARNPSGLNYDSEKEITLDRSSDFNFGGTSLSDWRRNQGKLDQQKAGIPQTQTFVEERQAVRESKNTTAETQRAYKQHTTKDETQEALGYEHTDITPTLAKRRAMQVASQTNQIQKTIEVEKIKKTSESESVAGANLKQAPKEPPKSKSRPLSVDLEDFETEESTKDWLLGIEQNQNQRIRDSKLPTPQKNTGVTRGEALPDASPSDTLENKRMHIEKAWDRLDKSLEGTILQNNELQEVQDDHTSLDYSLHDESLDEVKFSLPPLELFPKSNNFDEDLGEKEQYLLQQSKELEARLSEFGINAKVEDIVVGPVVTLFQLLPAAGTKASKILNVEKDLARLLRVASIRVLEVIPGRPYIGIEIPNPTARPILFGDVVQSNVFKETGASLPLVLGQDSSDKPVVVDLARMPHLLVAGTTGSGKSVGINGMLMGLLMAHTPEQLRLLLVDPKMLELSFYNGIPHLIAPTISDMSLAAGALAWCVEEMERRYRLMSKAGVRNIEGYNEKLNEQGDTNGLTEKLPFIVIVVDEFADMIMTVGKKGEELIVRLAQKSRAAGIHVILATQRPSVDVITGLIKANVPSRISYLVSSKIDSRTILDQAGAEKLLGRGDMLYLPVGSSTPRRVHGAFVEEDEIEKLCSYWRRQSAPRYIPELLENNQNKSASGESIENEDDLSEVIRQDIIQSAQVPSISKVQRMHQIGFNRAARILEQLQEEGLISIPDKRGRRSVL